MLQVTLVCGAFFLCFFFYPNKSLRLTIGSVVSRGGQVLVCHSSGNQTPPALSTSPIHASMLSAKQYAERKLKRKAEEDLRSSQQRLPAKPHIAQNTSRSALGLTTASIYINNSTRSSQDNGSNKLLDDPDIPTRTPKTEFSEV